MLHSLYDLVTYMYIVMYIDVMSYRKVTGHMILVLDQWMAF